MFCVVWEFLATAGREADFEQAYNLSGPWTALFRSSRGYRGTELLRDVATAGRYLTIDRWDSAAVYESFCREHAAEYAAIDAECRSLTTLERHVGNYEGSSN